MLRVIVNADDCGLNSIVNGKIEECIKAGRLTSTTIMANGEDLDGAKCLFDTYKKKISFGCHITLDEGKPMKLNQVLADNHFIENRDGEWYFTRELWKRKFILGNLKQAIIDECSTQIEFLLAKGFVLSHLDSHHHVHTAKGLIWLMPILCKKYSIMKYRRIVNCMPPSIGFYARQMWNVLQQLQMKECITTDRFGSFSNIYTRNDLSFLCGTNSLEIMCHPGHPKEHYVKEVEQLLSTDTIVRGFEIELINYNQF